MRRHFWEQVNIPFFILFSPTSFSAHWYFLSELFLWWLPNDFLISSFLLFFDFLEQEITVIQVYAPTSNAEEAEVERFYEDLQDLLELTPNTDVLFIIGDWNAKVGSQGTPGVTGKFGLGIQNEARQRLIEFCQENALVIANTLFQQHKRRLYPWTSPEGQHRNQTCREPAYCILSEDL